MDSKGNSSVRGLEWAAHSFASHDVPGLPDDVVSIAANRGVTDFKEFFKPTLKGSMPDPYVLKCMKEAVERGRAAIEKGEKVCIYGDYDVDGATSTAILVRYLRRMGCDVTFYIPQRLTEGYGPNTPAMHKLKDDGVDLLIVADSGTTAFEPLKVAQDIGMDVVVIDHHTAQKELPAEILVNPNRQDETGEYGYLCTAGLAFLYVVGLQRDLRETGFFEADAREEYDLRLLLGLAALGTVADVVPLRGLNRSYVKLGLPLMAEIPGIMALAEKNEVEPCDFSAYTCGFVFGPCINAAGRIDDTTRGSWLLTTDDADECAQMADELYTLNQERKKVQEQIEVEADTQAQAQADTNVIIVYGEEWHPGVVGIVASRIKDNYDRAAILIGKDGKGSARSIDGFDIGQAIIDARQDGLLIAGGGHPAAGGLTVDPDKIDELRDYMREKSKDVERPPLEADLEVECGDLTKRRVDGFKMLAPFGAGNSEPRVIIRNGMLTQAKTLKNKHVKGRLSGEKGDIDVILFNCVGKPMGDALLAAEGGMVDLYGKAKLNEWMGHVSVQVVPEDIRVVHMQAEQEMA